jgi:hypothetical protein
MELAVDGQKATEYERIINEVCNGERDPEDAVNTHSLFHAFTIKLLEFLHNSKKPVVFEKSPITENDERNTQFLSKQAFDYWRKADTDNAISKFEQYEIAFSSQIVSRDTAYAEQLHKLLSNGNTRILSIRGSLHSQTLPALLQARKIEFESVLFRVPYILSKQEEVIVKIIHGESPTKEDIALCFIQQDLEGLIPDYETKLKVKEKLSAMSSEDISRYIQAKQTSNSATKGI